MSPSFFSDNFGARFGQLTVGPSPAVAMALVTAFAAHNLEEIYSFELLAASAPWPTPVSRSTFALAAAILTGATALLAHGGLNGKRAWTGLFFLATCMIGLNAIGHIFRAIVIQAYVPGVATAALFVAPSCFVVLKQMISANGLSFETVGVSVVASVVATVPVIIAALAFAAVMMVPVNLIAR